MKYPKLVPEFLCKIPIHVRIESEEISEEGGPIIVFEGDLLCNYQDKAKTILTSEKKLVEITGSAYFAGDIAPNVASIPGGSVEIYGETRRIASGMKARNPDGTVNYTRLEVV